MRIIFTVVSCLLLIPRFAAAGPLSLQSIWWEFLNSDLTFGSSPAHQRGYDLDSQEIHGKRIDPWGVWDGTWEATTGPLIEQRLIRGGSGEVTQSIYSYGGGTFSADITLFRDGVFKTGTITASLLKTEVHVGELGDFVDVSYVIGHGTIDRSIARALGVTSRILGGDISSELELDDGSGYTTPARHASDGVAWVSLQPVPEPSSVVLMAVGGVSWLIRRRRKSANVI